MLLGTGAEVRQACQGPGKQALARSPTTLPWPVLLNASKGHGFDFRSRPGTWILGPILGPVGGHTEGNQSVLFTHQCFSLPYFLPLPLCPFHVPLSLPISRGKKKIIGKYIPKFRNQPCRAKPHNSSSGVMCDPPTQVLELILFEVYSLNVEVTF